MMILSSVYRALSALLYLLPLISCLLGVDTSLEPRIGPLKNGYTSEPFTITFYGAPDSATPAKNCEASVKDNIGSNTIAHPGCPWNGGYRGRYAGGDGSHANPVTAASKFSSNSSPIPQCGVWYSPFLQKWLICEDDCPSCPGQPGQAHFDIWVGGNSGNNPDNSLDLCRCEDTLTPGGDNPRGCAYWNVEIPSRLPVNTANLWDGSNCNMGIPQWY